MRRLIAAFPVLVLLVALPAAAQEEVSVSDLDADPGTYADQALIVVGEVVGDYGIRDDFVWFQVNDDPYVRSPLAETGVLAGTNLGIGVRLPRQMFSEEWGEPGGYGVRGPIVRVTGIFRYNHPSEEGDTYLAATQLDLVEPSRPMDRPPADPTPAIAGAILFAAGLLLFTLGYLRRRPR